LYHFDTSFLEHLRQMTNFSLPFLNPEQNLLPKLNSGAGYINQ